MSRPLALLLASLAWACPAKKTSDPVPATPPPIPAPMHDACRNVEREVPAGTIAERLGATRYRLKADRTAATATVTIEGEAAELGELVLFLGARNQGLGQGTATLSRPAGDAVSRRDTHLRASDGGWVHERIYTSSAVEFHARTTFSEDRLIIEELWWTPAGAEPPALGARRWLGTKEAWTLRITNEDEVEAWMEMIGLSSWPNDSGAALLDAVIEDPALWQGVIDAVAECQASRAGLTSARVDTPACVTALTECTNPQAGLFERFFLGRAPSRLQRCHHAFIECGAKETRCEDPLCTSACAGCGGACGSELSDAGPVCRCENGLCCSGEETAGCRCDENGCTGGDPHLVTFDGTYYDYQGVGEYILARSADAQFEVQTRTLGTERCGGFATSGVMAVRLGPTTFIVRKEGEDLVSLNGELLANGIFVREGIRISLEPDAVGFESAAGDVVVVQAAAGGRWLDAMLRPTPARRGTLSGLLGDGDGDPTNDLAPREQSAPSETVTRAYIDETFGPSWRLNAPESSMPYEEYESTATFTDETFPRGPRSTEGTSEAERVAARAACANVREALRSACEIDVACGGDDSAFFAGAEPQVILEPPSDGLTLDVVIDDDGVVRRILNGPRGPPAEVGCSDGQREGLVDQARSPEIAGCLGTWNGAVSMRAPATRAPCGDDLGTCAVPADLCAEGWHVCGTSGRVAEVAQLSPEQCSGAGAARYLTAISHCRTQNECSTSGPNSVYACFDTGDCSEPVCCGAACRSSFGLCRSGVWPEATTISDRGCGVAESRKAFGVLCCR